MSKNACGFDLCPSNVHSSPSTQIPKSKSMVPLGFYFMLRSQAFIPLPLPPLNFPHPIPASTSPSSSPFHVISCDSLMYLLAGDGPLVPSIRLQASRSDNKSCGPRWNRVHSSWQKEGKTNAPKVLSFLPHDGKRSIFPKTGYGRGQVGRSFRFRPVLSCSAH